LLLLAENEEGQEMDEDAFWPFAMFLYTLGLTVLWYAFRFDPTGTTGPLGQLILDG
jgi:hypothetical protein